MTPSMDSFEELLVDGDIFFAPSCSQWAQLLQVSPMTFRGRAIGTSNMINLISAMLSDICRHPEHFRLGFFSVGTHLSWLTLALFKSKQDWVRVELAHPTCGHCTWRGLIATPVSGGLYFGPDRFRQLQRGFELAEASSVKCPNCGNVLPMHPIWAEPRRDGEANLSDG